MSDKSTIEWTDATWNPIRGVKGNWHCTHVSEGCRNCYAERMNVRIGGPAYKPGADTFQLGLLSQPLRWRRPRRIFVCSMTDLFHEQLPLRFIAAVFGIMALSQRHTFQVLTKRAERMRDFVDHCDARIAVAHAFTEMGAWATCDSTFDWPLPNVWLGVSVEDQQTADERIPVLLETPAAVRWLSAEPLLGPLDLFNYLPIYPLRMPVENMPTHISWVVAGGESGPGARPMHPDWARSVRDQCQAAHLPFFFKQWGEWLHESQFNSEGQRERGLDSIRADADDTRQFVRVGKKAAGRLLDGREWNEWPEKQRA